MQSAGLRKCLYDHELADKAYFSDTTKKNIYTFYPQDGGNSQLALKLRHCRPMYTADSAATATMR